MAAATSPAALVRHPSLQHCAGQGNPGPSGQAVPKPFSPTLLCTRLHPRDLCLQHLNTSYKLRHRSLGLRRRRRCCSGRPWLCGARCCSLSCCCCCCRHCCTARACHPDLCGAQLIAAAMFGAGRGYAHTTLSSQVGQPPRHTTAAGEHTPSALMPRQAPPRSTLCTCWHQTRSSSLGTPARGPPVCTADPAPSRSRCNTPGNSCPCMRLQQRGTDELSAVSGEAPPGAAHKRARPSLTHAGPVSGEACVLILSTPTSVAAAGVAQGGCF